MQKSTAPWVAVPGVFCAHSQVCLPVTALLLVGLFAFAPHLSVATPHHLTLGFAGLLQGFPSAN